MGWLLRKIYDWSVKRREKRIDKMYETTEPNRIYIMDIAEYLNTKNSPICDICGINHSKIVVSSAVLGDGVRDRNYCRNCFIGGNTTDGKNSK